MVELTLPVTGNLSVFAVVSDRLGAIVSTQDIQVSLGWDLDVANTTTVQAASGSQVQSMQSALSLGDSQNAFAHAMSAINLLGIATNTKDTDRVQAGSRSNATMNATSNASVPGADAASNAGEGDELLVARVAQRGAVLGGLGGAFRASVKEPTVMLTVALLTAELLEGAVDELPIGQRQEAALLGAQVATQVLVGAAGGAAAAAQIQSATSIQLLRASSNALTGSGAEGVTPNSETTEAAAGGGAALALTSNDTSVGAATDGELDALVDTVEETVALVCDVMLVGAVDGEAAAVASSGVSVSVRRDAPEKLLGPLHVAPDCTVTLSAEALRGPASADVSAAVFAVSPRGYAATPSIGLAGAPNVSTLLGVASSMTRVMVGSAGAERVIANLSEPVLLSFSAPQGPRAACDPSETTTTYESTTTNDGGTTATSTTSTTYSPCGAGRCVSNGTGFTCQCPAGYSSKGCLTSVACAYWDDAAGRWSVDGCTVHLVDGLSMGNATNAIGSGANGERLVQCACDHLTSFAVMDMANPEALDVGSVLSRLCLKVPNIFKPKEFAASVAEAPIDVWLTWIVILLLLGLSFFCARLADDFSHYRAYLPQWNQTLQRWRIEPGVYHFASCGEWALHALSIFVSWFLTLQVLAYREPHQPRSPPPCMTRTAGVDEGLLLLAMGQAHDHPPAGRDLLRNRSPGVRGAPVLVNIRRRGLRR